MKKIKIGVSGCANIAERSMIPAIKATHGFELVAVASRSKEKAASFADTFSCEAVEGYENLINRDDINAVYIPLPTGLHEEWAMNSLNKGKHVLCEKSLATDFSSAQKLISKAKTSQLLIMENFMFPYHRQHAYVEKLLSEDAIGEIRFFRSAFGFPPRGKDDIRYNNNLGGGALLDAGGYVVKAAQIFLGTGLKLGSAFLKYDNQLKVDIYGGAIYKNDKDQIAHLSFSFDNYYQCVYELWGTKGKITVDRAFTAPPGFSPKILLEKQDYRREFAIEPDNHFINLLNEFQRSLIEKDFHKHWEDSLEQARLLNLIRECRETAE